MAYKPILQVVPEYKPRGYLLVLLQVDFIKNYKEHLEYLNSVISMEVPCETLSSEDVSITVQGSLFVY